MKRVTVIIPCYNEADGIGEVIKNFPRTQLRRQGYILDVLVIDNNSTDATAEIARQAGARVIKESVKGKGNALRTGFANLMRDTEYVAMLDGDATYRSQELLRLLEPLRSGFCNVVIGSRMHGRINEGSMATANRIGNRLFSRLVRTAYHVATTDVLTGYFAWSRATLERLRPHLGSAGFAIEMEMITKMARLGEGIYSVPISYDARAGKSSLHPLQDGLRIFKVFLTSLRWRPPATRKRQVVFVADAVLPYHKGGKEKRLYEIATRLVNDDREVHIYTMQWWQGSKTIIHEGVHYHALSRFYPLYHKGRRSMLQAIMFGLAGLKLLFVKFDVIDVDHMPFFPLFSIRVVTWLKHRTLYATWLEVTSRETWQAYIGRLPGTIAWAIEWLAMQLPDMIIAISPHTTTRLRQNGSKKKIMTVPLGANIAAIAAAEPAVEVSDLVFVGRLLDHKNVDQLVRAVAILGKAKPELKCHIIGRGPEKETLQQLIAELGLQKRVIIFDNIEDDQQVYGLMKASKLMVHPTVREGFGLVVVEANAAGLPVITTPHPHNAARDLITPGVNGALAEPTPEALAAQILAVLQSRDTFRPTQGIEQYEWQVVATRTEEAFGL